MFLVMSHTDSIEANVESAEVHVERGTEQLQHAAYYQVQQCCFSISLTLIYCNTVSIISGLSVSFVLFRENHARGCAFWL